MPAHEHINRFQLRYRPQKKTWGYEKHRIQALDTTTGDVKGSLTWSDYRKTPFPDEETGRIENVEVSSEERRKGVATSMYEMARKLAQESRGAIPYPEHSPARTATGDKWARAVGGYVPPLEED